MTEPSPPDETNPDAEPRVDADVARQQVGGAAARWLEKWLNPVVDFWEHGGVVAGLIALAVGASLWPIVHPLRLQDAALNRLDWDERVWAAASSVLGIVIVLGLYAWSVHRAHSERNVTVRAQLDALNRRWSILLALPLVVQIVSPAIEEKHPAGTLALIALVTFIVGVWIARLRSIDDVRMQSWQSRTERWGPRAPWIVVIALSAFWGIFFSTRAIIVHHGFGTSVFDLGLYDQIIYQSVHGNFLGCGFMKSGVHHSAHFDPILVLISPLYLIYPRAEFLLVLQSFWISSAAIPIFLLTRHTTGRPWLGVVMAGVFFLYPAAQGIALYDFHSLALAIPVVVWVIYCGTVGNVSGYWVAVALACLVREDVSLLLSVIAFGFIVGGDKRMRLHAVLTIVAVLVYFVVVKKFVMISDELLNCSDGGVCFAYYFKDLIVDNKGGIEIGMTLLSHPGYVLEVAMKQEKLIYLAKIFLPLLFLPFLARGYAWMMLYGLLFTLLASKDAVFSVAFQYSTLLFPVAFALTAFSLGRVVRGESLAWFSLSKAKTTLLVASCLIAASLLIQVKFGGMVPNYGFKAGWGRPHWFNSAEVDREYQWLQKTIGGFEPDARVSATRRLAAHIGHRDKVSRFGKQPLQNAKYLLVHDKDLRKRRYSKEKLNQVLAEGLYEKVSSEGRLHLYRRVQ